MHAAASPPPRHLRHHVPHLPPTPTNDAVRKLPKNFTAISMMQSVKRQCIEENSTAAKRCRADDAQALALAAHMCKV